MGAPFLCGPNVAKYNHGEAQPVGLIFSYFSQFHMNISWRCQVEDLGVDRRIILARCHNTREQNMNPHLCGNPNSECTCGAPPTARGKQMSATKRLLPTRPTNQSTVHFKGLVPPAGYVPHATDRPGNDLPCPTVIPTRSPAKLLLQNKDIQTFLILY
jgi:hypothetical protein